MSFNDYKGGIGLGAGLYRLGEDDFPLLQTSDIQAEEGGKRLDVLLAEYARKIEENTGKPAEDLSEELTQQARLVEQIKLALHGKVDPVGISSIEKTDTDGLVDIYTIKFTDGSTTTFTVTNGEVGKSAYKYAQEAGYLGTETEFAEKLAGTDMVGTWVLNDDPNLSTIPDNCELWFLSNGVEYRSIGRALVSSVSYDIYTLYYKQSESNTYTSVYFDNPSGRHGVEHGWRDEANKTIDIIKDPDPTTAAWVRANAKKSDQQQESDVRLKTKNKRLVDAINELSDQIAEGGGGGLPPTSADNAGKVLTTNDEGTPEWQIQNFVPSYSISITSDQSVATMITMLQDLGADISKFNIVVVDIINLTTLNLGLQIKQYGETDYYIRGIDLTSGATAQNITDWSGVTMSVFTTYFKSPLEKPISSLDNNTVIDTINDLISATNSVTGTWVFKDDLDLTTMPEYMEIDYIYNGITAPCMVRSNVGPSSWGIYCLKFNGEVYTYNPSGSYGISHGWRDEVFKTIEILSEPSAEVAAWIRANATKQGGSSGGSGFEMPQIRFANVQGDSMFLSEANPFIFTVEIVGGGALQEGDLLQICVRRKYWNRVNGTEEAYKHKWKLRQVVQREITSEDIGKRFIPISVTLQDVLESGEWLFRNDRSNGSSDTHSYMYFRIKRVTKLAYGGECDAIFSNVEKVAKTYKSKIKKLTIK